MLWTIEEVFPVRLILFFNKSEIQSPQIRDFNNWAIDRKEEEFLLKRRIWPRSAESVEFSEEHLTFSQDYE